ncbi:hypothetical protein [Longitalea arenae]|uniref:hypothetical protein n=1 Tax=Longitalea arenae TaxID=2812558 RepID=UPI0019680E8C|nr:hypothetical protein [Longitalea arenae]
MKKVKVMLSAITVLAVVSGALAFKANNVHFKNFSGLTTWYTTTAGGTNCSIETPNLREVSTGGSVIKAYTTTTNNSTFCKSRNLTDIEL